jgi:GNAT superfamily N-acetyltransferase
MTADAALDPHALRAAYDTLLRAREDDPLPAGASVERDGPLLRFVGLDGGGFVAYRDLGGLGGADLDALIARQRDFFAARGESVEWKLHGHDEPADLPGRLRAAGFRPDDPETVVVGPVAGLAAMQPVVPEGVRLREVTAREDLDRVAAFTGEVSGGDRGWLADGLAKELTTDPQGLTVVVAEADDAVVGAGWIRYVGDTPFATLWGGSTVPEWRRRGIYRALVVYRARLAAARGRTYLQVDASDESRPILERLGFVAVTTTTPYVFRPSAG